MPLTWFGLLMAFASALVTRTAYSLEHDAAAPLSPRRPFRSVRMLPGDRRWLAAFGAATAGRLIYVAGARAVGAGSGGAGVRDGARAPVTAGAARAGDTFAKLVGYGGSG